MKNTRRGGPGGCVLPMKKRCFSGHRPRSGARRTFSVLPKRRLSEGKAAVLQGRNDCGTDCGQRENGEIQLNKYNKKTTIFVRDKKYHNFFD